MTVRSQVPNVNSLPRIGQQSVRASYSHSTNIFIQLFFCFSRKSYAGTRKSSEAVLGTPRRYFMHNFGWYPLLEIIQLAIEGKALRLTKLKGEVGMIKKLRGC